MYNRRESDSFDTGALCLHVLGRVLRVPGAVILG